MEDFACSNITLVYKLFTHAIKTRQLKSLQMWKSIKNALIFPVFRHCDVTEGRR